MSSGVLTGSSRDFNEGAEVGALDLVMPNSPLPADQVLGGSPSASAIALGEFAGCEVGVWEMTTGVASDTEVEELFVVLSGKATVEFVDEGRKVQLYPGIVMRLAAGQRTVWTVTETLRKVYLSA